MTMNILALSKFLVPLALFYIAHSITGQTSDYLCTKEYCEEARTQNPCDELPKECNSTTNKGIMMLDPSLCNCCDFCLVYLEEGDDCVTDGRSQPFHQYICGPGLRCHEENSICVPLETACMNKTKDFDESQKDGTWGFTQMRPVCDAVGDYSPAYCIGGSICYCVNQQGERIFGEAVYTGPGIQQSMNCECSLANWKADRLAKEMGIHNIPVHCLEDGSYDLLQCNDDMCQCLSSDTKTPINDDKSGTVYEINLTEETMQCFDTKIHTPRKYRRECEEKLEEMLLEIQFLKESGITPVGVKLPNCQYDGRYGRVMVSDTEKTCVDPDGKPLESFIVPHSDTLLSEEMDCNCARTRWILKREGQTELPICCENGNFRQMQCRRGKCYCVDCNGNQLGVEVNENNKEDLSCADNSMHCCIPEEKKNIDTTKSSFINNQWDPTSDSNSLN